jgi:hypothetical protein
MPESCPRLPSGTPKRKIPNKNDPFFGAWFTSDRDKTPPSPQWGNEMPESQVTFSAHLSGTEGCVR